MFALLRLAFLVFAAWLVWYIAGHWNRWTGAARLETTDDAYIGGDVTPLSAKVSGYIASVAVDDYQTVHKGDLIATIDPSDYDAQLALAQANLAAAQASLSPISQSSGMCKRSLIRQAEATIEATDCGRAALSTWKTKRQHDLLQIQLGRHPAIGRAGGR